MILNFHNQQQIGNYQLIRPLGTGGFAEVYLGEHVLLGTPAAIKILKKQDNQEARDEFLAEARRAATLRHPHIVSLYECGLEQDMLYLVMDYAPHGTLRDHYPRRSRVPLPVIANYIRQVADALWYVHQQKLVHRDVKPENMLIGNNHTLLLSDFGISVTAHRTETMTPQQIIGTFLYMAPEQLDGHACSASDQYSLAIVVYEWLCGTPPFSGNVPSLMWQHHSQTPRSLQHVLPDLPPAVDDLVLKALAKEPQARFPTIMDFAQALEGAAKRVTRTASSVPPSSQRLLGLEFSKELDANQGSQVFLQLVHEEAATDHSQAALIEKIQTSSQSLNLLFKGFFTTTQEHIQLALIVEKRLAWEARLQVHPMTIEECYRQGLQARAYGKNEEAALWWLQGITLNPHYRNGIFVKLVKEEFQKLLSQHIVILQTRATQARQDEQLELEIALLTDIQTLDPYNQENDELLLQAQQEKEYQGMCEEAYRYLADGDILMVVEQLRVLQSHAATLRGLAPLAEKIFSTLMDRVRQAINQDALLQAQPILALLQEFVPHNVQWQILQDEWCDALYQQAMQRADSETPASALALVDALAKVVPHSQSLFDLQYYLYGQMCAFIAKVIQEDQFAQAQLQLSEMDRHFPQAERHAYEPVNTSNFLQVLSTLPSGILEEIQQLPTAIEQLHILLQIEHDAYIIRQQRHLFLNGEKARQQGDYAEAFRCWSDLYQQNSIYIGAVGPFVQRFQAELFTTILAWRKRKGIGGLIRRFWWERHYWQNGEIPLEQHLGMVLWEYAEQAGERGHWQLASDILRNALQYIPSNTFLEKRLTIAEQNVSVVTQYEQAQHHVAQGEIVQALPLLQTIWTQAPYYGDPAQLALATNLYSPLAPSKYIKNGCTVGIVGSLAGLFFQSVFLCVLVALVSTALIIYPLYRRHSGRPYLHVLTVLSGCVVAIVLTLLFSH